MVELPRYPGAAQRSEEVRAVWWTGLQVGDSRLYAESFRVQRKLDKLLEGLAYAWESFQFELHPEARYDPEHGEVHSAAKSDRREGPVDLYLWYEGDRDEGDTYLLVGWYANRRRAAERLAEEAAKISALQVDGVHEPDLEKYEWFVRELSLGEVEALAPEEQWRRISEFVRETVEVVERSGLL